MARNRVIYQSDIVFVGNTGATGTTDGGTGIISQLDRVQSANYSFDVARTDVNQFGQLAAIDRIILEQPTVSLDLNYLVLTGDNETAVGLSIGNESAIAAILSGDDMGAAAVATKNYFIATAAEGADAGNTGDTAITGETSSIIGIGNCFISSYTVNGAVGDFINADISVEGLNMTFDGGGGSNLTTTVDNPTVSASNGTPVVAPINVVELNAARSYTDTSSTIPAALRPGNVGLTTSGVVGFDSGDLKYQNFTIGFDLSRENLEKLGSRFAFAKEIEFPAAATMDFSALVGDVSTGAAGAGGADTAANFDSLDSIVTGADADFNVAIDCSGQADEKGLKYTLKGAKLISQSVSSSIGDNKSVDLSFESQIGGPSDTDHGIKIEAVA